MPPSRKLLWFGIACLLCGVPHAFAEEPTPSSTEEDGPLGPKVTPAAVESVPRPAPGPSKSGTLFPGAPTRDPNTTTIGPAPGAPTTAAEATQQPSTLPPAPTGTPAEREKWLAARIDEILGRPSLQGVRIGVMVAEIDSGRTLYARSERALQNPASNAKLFTTAAALGLLGPEFKFKTSLHAQSVKSGEVQGDLYIRGSGDPSLTSEDLWRLVADMAGTGVRRITGGISVDDTYFDDVRVGPAFDQKEEDFAFRAPSGAVSLNYNACTIHVAPATKEGPPKVTVEPQSAYFTIVNTAKTTTRGKTELTINTKEVEGHTEITVGGTIKKGAGEVVEHRRVAHPDLYTAYSLRELLVRRGIKFGSDLVKGAAVPPGARQLATHHSPPLGVIVREVNKTSNNFMAEQLLKTLGAEVIGKPGTWPKGVEAVGKFLTQVGIAPSTYKMTNGSGLYDADRFTASQIVELLRYAYRDFRWAADFVGSLALAGADGTIGHRMEASPAQRWVRAKTGTLAGVSCLSGYAGAPGHMPLAFAILMNGIGETATQEARRAQDAMAEAMVTFLGAK